MRRKWSSKFADALRGLSGAIRGHSSFTVHLICAALVCGIAGWLRVQRWHWVALIACISTVLVLELVNTSIEHLARAVTDRPHPEVGRALDIAAAAVLVASVGAAVVGLIVLSNAWLAQ